MNIPLVALAGLTLAGTYFGFKRKDPSMNISSCFFDKLATPLFTLFNDYHSNSLFLIDSIKEDHIICNTPYEKLYGIEIVSNQTIQRHIQAEKIEQIINDCKDNEDAFFWYVIHKQDKFQKQYIFSHNALIAKTFADYLDVPLLSGLEITNVLYNQYMQNSFYTKDKQIKQSLNIKKDTLESEPEFMSFKRLAKQAIAKNHKELDIFQAFKHLDIKESNIQALFRLKFEGSIWFYINIGEHDIKKHISKLISYSKLVGDKRPFMELQNMYNGKEFNLAIINAIAYLKEYNEEIIGSLGTALKTSFIPKEILRSKHLQKNPIKCRDSEFDFLVKSNFLHNFIASVHKRSTDRPDIYGIDKNGAFVNYSFSVENDNPHSCIIAKSGSGKSVSKQKIISQLIGLNFVNGECSNLGLDYGNVRLRMYDIGFSDANLVNLLKSNPKNQVAHIESSLYAFSYNLAYLPNLDNLELFEADLQFNLDLISIILETQNTQALTINESAFFKKIIKKIYKNKEFQRYRIRDIRDKHKELYEKLISLGYEDSTFLQDLKEKEFDFLKVPLLIDIVKSTRKESANMQIKEAERADYESLSRKLDAIEKLDIFSDFDKIDIANVDVLSMDLNNFKESSLFVPIFLSIFQKTYLKDRDYAISCNKTKKPKPKLFYAIEEARNFFRVPYFTVMFEKLAREARKYNVHLCFITQNAEDIPLGILKNIDTRIFLLRPDKKLEVIDETKNALNIPKNVEIALLNTEKHELCVWYSAGVFNLKFEITKEEMEIFSTNPNDVQNDVTEDGENKKEQK